MNTNKIYCADSKEILASIPSDSVDLVVTSPPYFQQRDYGGGRIGNEKNKRQRYWQKIF
jgi:site-specific DNA-methyltransferase (adenine-specific)